MWCHAWGQATRRVGAVLALFSLTRSNTKGKPAQPCLPLCGPNIGCVQRISSGQLQIERGCNTCQLAVWPHQQVISCGTSLASFKTRLAVKLRSSQAKGKARWSWHAPATAVNKLVLTSVEHLSLAVWATGLYGEHINHQQSM